MASGMQQTLQSCQVLAAMIQAQMVDEDKFDPMPAKTTTQLEELVIALRKTKEVLAREAIIFSDRADFSGYSDRELVAMTAFVRESSRMLSIVLAGGAAHFLQGHGMSIVQELKMMELYIDSKVKDFMSFSLVLDVLQLQEKLSKAHRSGGSDTKIGGITHHPDLLAFEPIDRAKGLSSEESLMRVAELCESFARQCRTVAVTRRSKLDDRIAKNNAKTTLLEEVDALMPMLRQHVLRIGLGKSQQQEMAKLTTGGNSARYASLCTMFTHVAVENAHRAVEDCRERLIQEAMARKVKAERLMAKRSPSRGGRSAPSRSASPMNSSRGQSAGPPGSPNSTAGFARMAPGQAFTPAQSPASPGLMTDASTTLGPSPGQRSMPVSPGLNSSRGMSPSPRSYPGGAKQQRGPEDIPRRDRGDAPSGKASGRGMGRGKRGKA
mmetsp:Transcript_137228/g.256225  ORF Transcript_137228/g.256225 Transcript_137228/m.256225 type:complete len:437 (+) Transcript_137228:65-1375(+)